MYIRAILFIPLIIFGFILAPVAHAQDDFVLSQFPPGLSLKDVNTRLQAASIGGGIEQPGGVAVFEVAALPGLFQRQQLALIHDGVRLRMSALVIGLSDVGDLDSPEQTFQRILSELIGYLGRPSSHFERGNFTGNITNLVYSEQLVRLYEWRTSSGVIRFGIPRRLDRSLRMEVQYRKSFPGFNDTMWGVESVR